MRFIKLFGGALLASASVPLGVGWPAAALAQPAGFAREAEALLEAAYPADDPGAAVIVMRGGKLLFAGGRGLADLEARRAITPDTAFRLGSITKQFTAAAILQLVAEGKLSLDDPLSRFLPNFPQPGARATVRQLLNHSSGIADFTKVPGWMLSPPSMRPNSTAELVALMRERSVMAEPGKRWEYNNGGYVLLGAILEKVTGKPWQAVIAERIARPLGLATIGYAGAPPSGAAVARGYRDEGGAMRPAQGVHISVAHAAGGLVGSVSDMAKWAQALHHGRVMPPALYAEMIKPARLADGSTQPYGFGLRLGRIRGRAALVHGGAGRGLDTDSAYLPAEDLFVAVFANSDDPATDPSVLVRRLAALALGDPLPSFRAVQVDPATLAPLFGAYDGGDGPPRRFFSRDGKLYLGRGAEEMEVTAAAEDRFFAEQGLHWFRIVRRPGAAPEMEIHRLEADTPIRAVRTGDAPAPFAVPRDVLTRYVGRYATEGPVVTVALDDAGRLTLAGPDGRPMPLRPVSETEFRIEGGMMRLVFQPEGERVDRLTLYRGARELHGRRVAQ